MLDAAERIYFSGRAQTARRLEARAKDPEVAAIHRTMAERYEALAAGLPVRPMLKVVSAG